MSNALLTPSIIGREALMILENNTVAANLVHRGHQPEFTGAKKVGDTIQIRTRSSLTAQEFTSAVSVQNLSEDNIDMVIEKHFDVTVAVTSKEWTLSLEDFSSQVVEPAMVAINQAIDTYVLSKYVEFSNYFGTAGDPPDSIADLADVDRVCNENKIPTRGRVGIINPRAKADMFGIEAVWSAEKRADAGTALREAEIGNIMGINWYMDQNVYAHTAGTPGGTPLTNGAVSAGVTSIAVDGLATSGTYKKGDIISFATHSTTYTVLANATASSGAIASLTFFPALTADVADGVAVSLVASHTANLVMHPDALTLAIVPLELPRGAAQASYSQYKGMGIRVVFDYNSTSKTDTISFDVMVGAKVRHNALGIRVLG